MCATAAGGTSYNVATRSHCSHTIHNSIAASLITCFDNTFRLRGTSIIRRRLIFFDNKRALHLRKLAAIYLAASASPSFRDHFNCCSPSIPGLRQQLLRPSRPKGQSAYSLDHCWQCSVPTLSLSRISSPIHVKKEEIHLRFCTHICRPQTTTSS